MVRCISILLAVVLSGAGAAWAAAPAGAPSKEILDRIKNLENQIHELKEQQKQQEDQRVREKENQCMTAIGVKEFCSCLAANLPMEVDFTRYIQTVVGASGKSSPVAEMDKKIADRTFMARDICAGKGK